MAVYDDPYQRAASVLRRNVAAAPASAEEAYAAAAAPLTGTPISQLRRDEAVQDVSSQFGKGVAAGTYSLVGGVPALLGAGANLVRQGAGDNLLNTAAGMIRRGAEIGPDVASLADAQRTGRYGAYLAGLAGESLPTLVTALVGGGAGGAIAKGVGERAAVKAAEEYAARKALAAGTDQASARTLQVAKRVLLDRAAKSKAAQIGAAAGRGIGATAGMLPPTVAGSAEGVPDENGNPVGGLIGATPGQTAKILAGDVAASAVGAAPELRALGRLGGAAVTAAEAGRPALRAIGREAAIQTGIGAASGVGMAAAQRAGHAAADDRVSMMSPDALHQYLEAAVGGGVLGGALGGASEGAVRAARGVLKLPSVLLNSTADLRGAVRDAVAAAGERARAATGESTRAAPGPVDVETGQPVDVGTPPGAPPGGIVDALRGKVKSAVDAFNANLAKVTGHPVEETTGFGEEDTPLTQAQHLSRDFEEGNVSALAPIVHRPSQNPYKFSSNLRDVLAASVPLDNPIWMLPHDFDRILGGVEKLLTSPETATKADAAALQAMHQIVPQAAQHWEALGKTLDTSTRRELEAFNNRAATTEDGTSLPDTALSNAFEIAKQTPAQRAMLENIERGEEGVWRSAQAKEDEAAANVPQPTTAPTAVAESRLREQLANETDPAKQQELQSAYRDELLKGSLVTERKDTQKARDFFNEKSKSPTTVEIEPGRLDKVPPAVERYAQRVRADAEAAGKDPEAAYNDVINTELNRPANVRRRLVSLDNLVARHQAQQRALTGESMSAHDAVLGALGDLHLAGIKVDPDSLTPGSLGTNKKTGADLGELSKEDVASLRQQLREMQAQPRPHKQVQRKAPGAKDRAFAEIVRARNLPAGDERTAALQAAHMGAAKVGLRPREIQKRLLAAGKSRTPAPVNEAHGRAMRDVLMARQQVARAVRADKSEPTTASKQSLSVARLKLHAAKGAAVKAGVSAKKISKALMDVRKHAKRTRLYESFLKERGEILDTMEGDAVPAAISALYGKYAEHGLDKRTIKQMDEHNSLMNAEHRDRGDKFQGTDPVDFAATIGREPETHVTREPPPIETSGGDDTERPTLSGVFTAEADSRYEKELGNLVAKHRVMRNIDAAYAFGKARDAYMALKRARIEKGSKRAGSASATKLRAALAAMREAENAVVGGRKKAEEILAAVVGGRKKDEEILAALVKAGRKIGEQEILRHAEAAKGGINKQTQRRELDRLNSDDTLAIQYARDAIAGKFDTGRTVEQGVDRAARQPVKLAADLARTKGANEFYNHLTGNKGTPLLRDLSAFLYNAARNRAKLRKQLLKFPRESSAYKSIAETIANQDKLAHKIRVAMQDTPNENHVLNKALEAFDEAVTTAPLPHKSVAGKPGSNIAASKTYVEAITRLRAHRKSLAKRLAAALRKEARPDFKDTVLNGEPLPRTSKFIADDIASVDRDIDTYETRLREVEGSLAAKKEVAKAGRQQSDEPLAGKKPTLVREETGVRAAEAPGEAIRESADSDAPDLQAETQALNALAKRMGLRDAIVEVRHAHERDLNRGGGYSTAERVIYINSQLRGEARIEVLAHEFGHHVIRSELARAMNIPIEDLAHLRARDSQAFLALVKRHLPKLHDDFLKDYQAWIAKNLNIPLRDVRVDNAPEFRSRQLRKALSTSANRRVEELRSTTLRDALKSVDDDIVHITSYVASVEEYLANNIAKALTYKDARTPLTKFFKGIADKLKIAYGALFKRAGGSGKAAPPGVEKWVKSLFDRTTLDVSQALKETVPAEVAKTAVRALGEAVAAIRNPSHGGSDAPPPGAGHGNSAPEPSSIKALIKFIRYRMSPETRVLLNRKLSGPGVTLALQRAYKNSPLVLRAMRDPKHGIEARIIYSFLAWQRGELKTPKGTNALFSLRDDLASLAKLATGGAYAQRVFSDISNDNINAIRQLATESPKDARSRRPSAGRMETVDLYDVRSIVGKERGARQQRFDKMAKAYDKAYNQGMRVFGAAIGRIRNSGVPALSAIGAKLQRHVGEAGGDAGMIRGITHATDKAVRAVSDIIKPLTPTEQLHLATAMKEQVNDHPNPVVKEAIGKLRAWFSELHQMATDVGIRGRFGDALGFRENYFPIVMKMHPDTIGTLRKILEKPEYESHIRYALGRKLKNGTVEPFAGSKADAVSKILELAVGTVFAPDAAAKPTGRPWRARNFQLLGFLREHGTPEDKKAFVDMQSDELPDILAGYVYPLIREIELSKRFGPEGRDLEKMLTDAVAQGATPEQINAVRAMMDNAMGRVGLDGSPTLRKIFSADLAGKLGTQKVRTGIAYLQTYQNLRVLPLATLSSLVDPMGIGVRTGGDMKLAWRGFKAGMKSIYSKSTRAELLGLLRSLGSADDFNAGDILHSNFSSDAVEGGARKINDIIFKANGLAGWTRATRFMALIAAHGFLLRHAGMDNPTAVRYMQDLNLHKGDVISSPDNPGARVRILTPEERRAATPQERARDDRVRDALLRFVDEAILRPSSQQAPVWFGDPYMGLVTQYKPFMYAIYDQISKRIGTELKHGNASVLLPAMMYLPIVAATELLRGFIQYGPDGNPSRRDWGPDDYGLYALDRSGLLGPVASFHKDAINDIKHHNLPGTSFLGPTYQQADSYLDVLTGTGNPPRALATSLPLEPLYAGRILGKQGNSGGHAQTQGAM